MAASDGGTRQGETRRTIGPGQQVSTQNRKNPSEQTSVNRGVAKDVFEAPESKSTRTAETALDSLFNSQESYETNAPDAAPQFSPMDTLRRRFVTELIPAFDGLAEKYAAKGVILELDADHFINGGRNVNITIEYQSAGTRLDGVVTDAAIAFTETRFSTADRGGVSASGPSLRTRDLSAHLFRDFVCRQIAPLVQSALRRRR